MDENLKKKNIVLLSSASLPKISSHSSCDAAKHEKRCFDVSGSWTCGFIENLAFGCKCIFETSLVRLSSRPSFQVLNPFLPIEKLMYSRLELDSSVW
ncbi:hypothetical protein CEXT_708451 [Caerostris extrusa]|uniref:Uncharacterized protein n=1 Tax=Caerostris extrusa TaxID=172846 RepID=A0AAV4SUX0_CAEEX|nr:hypothetical protein CEXT_708451 [Caerostris extrusa]